MAVQIQAVRDDQQHTYDLIRSIPRQVPPGSWVYPMNVFKDHKHRALLGQ